MGLFKAERQAIEAATETAKQGINVSLVIASAAVVIAAIALVVVMNRG